MMYIALGCAVVMLLEAIALALLLGMLRDRSLVVVPLVVAGCALLLAAACWSEYQTMFPNGLVPPPPIDGSIGGTRGLDIWEAFVIIAIGMCVLCGVLRLFGFDAVRWDRDGLRGEEPPRWR
jgi:hypothetical protein